MATRSTRFILKNNKDATAPFSGATLYAGEPIVNTAAGIMMFSGVTSGTLGWTPAGDGSAGSGGNNNFFEVGSNLYNLKIRNKITHYNGTASLAGQFLSGTTNGFVLAPISSIVGVDTYVTGFTYNDSNVLTIKQNIGQPDRSVLINIMSGLTVNGIFSATTANFGTENVTTLNATGATITNLNVNTENVTTLNATGGTITTLTVNTENVTTLNATGATITNLNVNTENVTALNATGATITNLNVNTENVTTLNATGATITTSNVGTENVTTLNATGGTITTLNSTTLNATGGTITTLNSTTINGGSINVNNLTITGTATYNKTATGATELVNYSTLTAFSQTTDVYVTGATYSPASSSSNSTTWSLQYHGTPLNGPYTFSGQNTYTTGGTYNNTEKKITFLRNDGSTGYTVDLSTIDVNDTYVTGGTVTTAPSNNSINGQTQLSYNNAEVGGPYYLPFTDVFTTGFTYNPANNTFTLKDNSGNTFNQSFNTVTGLTVNGNLTITGTTNSGTLQSTALGANLVVYTTGSGVLTTESGFEYNATDNKLVVGNLAVTNATSAATFGAGGVVVGSGGDYGTAGNGDLTVHGSLTVFGQTVSAFTSNLYIEDNNVTLNYNPTGNTTSASIGAGWTIQSGNGLAGGDVNLDIRNLYTLTGTTAGQVPAIPYTTEYNVSGTGYANRGWVTQLNDIVIRSTNVTTPNGVRVIAEFDVLDGGSY